MKFFSGIYFKIAGWLAERGFTLDKYANSLHFYGSFFLMIILAGVLGINIFVSAAIVLGVGIAKELFDKFVRGTEFSWMDIVFDLIGIACGIIFCAGVSLR